jgi:hypothetical protein
MFYLQADGSTGLHFSEAGSGHVLEFVAYLEHSKVDPKTLVRINSSSILIQGIPKI